MTVPTAPGTPGEIYSITRLNQEAQALLTHAFPLLWVEGELSNLARPSSGHLYFTLKDNQAQVRCAMFRNRNIRLRFGPENGMQVRVRARVGLYAARGEFQLSVEHMEEAGAGDLQQRFDRLKQQLAAEGLFDPTRKLALPAFPRRLAVITSPTGAALRDIIHVLGRRFPLLTVRVYPVPVQGIEAPRAISEAIALADHRRDCDIIIVARGGGSLEDLWAFNEAAVARAIAACGLPVVSGIGHEIDFSIADFVADQRAPTPSAAAEAVSPNGDDVLATLARYHQILLRNITRWLASAQQRLLVLRQRVLLQHPNQRLQYWNQRLDDLETRVRQTVQHNLAVRRARTNEIQAALRQCSPRAQLLQTGFQMEWIRQRLLASMAKRLYENRNRLLRSSRGLDTVSPLATLRRGYAIVTRRTDNSVLRSSAEAAPGDALKIRLADGGLEADVTRLTSKQ